MKHNPEKKFKWYTIVLVIAIVFAAIITSYTISKKKIFLLDFLATSIGAPTTPQINTKVADSNEELIRNTTEKSVKLFRYNVEIPNYGKYLVESPTELTDVQVYEAAKQQISKDATNQDGFGQVGTKNKSTYTIQAPDGHTYSIEGPDGASQQDVINAVLAQHPGAGIPQTQTQQKPFTFMLNGSPVICTKFSGIVDCNTL